MLRYQCNIDARHRGLNDQELPLMLLSPIVSVDEMVEEIREGAKYHEAKMLPDNRCTNPGYANLPSRRSIPGSSLFMFLHQQIVDIFLSFYRDSPRVTAARFVGNDTDIDAPD